MKTGAQAAPRCWQLAPARGHWRRPGVRCCRRRHGCPQLGSSGAEATSAVLYQHIHILHRFWGLSRLFAHSRTAAKCSAAWRCSPPWRRAADLVCRQITRAGCPCECVLCHLGIALVGQRCLGRNGHSRLPQQWSARAMAGAARRMGAAARGAHQGRPDSGAAHSRCFATFWLSHRMGSIRRAVWRPRRQVAPAAPEWQNNFFDKGPALLRASSNGSSNYKRLFKMRGWRLRPAPPNFKHGAGHLARPDKA